MLTATSAVDQELVGSGRVPGQATSSLGRARDSPQGLHGGGIFLQRQPLVGVDLAEQERRRKLNNLGLAQRAAWQERNDAAKRLYEVVARHRMTKLVAGFEVKVKVSYSKNEITVTGCDPEEEMAQMAQAVEAKRQRFLDSEKPGEELDDIHTLP